MNKEEHRINLRLPSDVFEAIDDLRVEGIGKMSRNTWVADAIREKIERERAHGQQKPKDATPTNDINFYEFFAGGGMAREGLGVGWNCLFANDFDPMKGQVYRKNWDGGVELLIEDVNKVSTSALPGLADFVWASFPCQDLSLAGNYEGIGHRSTKEQTRSGTFWPFWQLMRNLMKEGRAPKLIVLENVYGALTSHDGKDFAAICSAYSGANYKFGAVVIDARHFVPQSRQRVFIVGVRGDIQIPAELIAAGPTSPWHPTALIKALSGTSKEAQKKWVWWRLPTPSARTQDFADLVEDHPKGVKWHTKDETKKLLGMMSTANLEKIEVAQRSKRRMVGALYKRTRIENGIKVQRAEVRFDDVAGCLRTPSGGSSRQQIVLIEGSKIRSRLLSTREAARLMGLPDDYWLPENYNDAYHVAGDGVAVPVVRFLSEHLFLSILKNQ